MRYGKGGEVFCAEREELDGPAPKDKTLIPGLEGIWGHGSNGFRDEAHDVVGVVVELENILERVRVETNIIVPLCLIEARHAPAREKPKIRVDLLI